MMRPKDVSATGRHPGRPSPARVRPAPVLVAKVQPEDAPKMRLVYDDDMIETLRRSSRSRVRHTDSTRDSPTRHDLRDAHARQAALEGRATDAVAISMDPAMALVVPIIASRLR